ncbi:hypothetical protein EYF80_066673 [Liparis tanakae]|uniref:Secreted protein n=1 Tax=Liparis tanakae TaxID=230148 RepID=A0A4Z2E3B1_9TELE|nr:hypothetical protein EYF80_066673 [Liparis tanakae]
MSSFSCATLFIRLSRVLACLDESSRSLRANDTSSSCFSRLLISPSLVVAVGGPPPMEAVGGPSPAGCCRFCTV